MRLIAQMQGQRRKSTVANHRAAVARMGQVSNLPEGPIRAVASAIRAES